MGASAARAQRLQTEHLTEADGLPSSLVRDLVQDVNGRLWVATRAGLASYDGQQLRSFEGVGNVATRTLAALTVDAEQAVWAVSSTLPPLLVRFNGRTWQRVATQAISPPADTAFEDEQVLRLAIHEIAGTREVLIGTNRGLLRLRGGRWSRLGSEDGWSAGEVFGLAAYGGTVFLAGREGLCELRDQRVECPYGDPQSPIGDERLARPIRGLRLETSPNGPRLWLATSTWIGYLDLASRRLEVVASDLQVPLGSGTMAIGVDGLGGIYYGSTAGAWLLDSKGGSRLRLGVAAGLVGEGLTSFLLDREGNAWLGGLRGLTMVPSRRFLSYGADQGLLENEVTAIAELDSQTLLFGHNQGLTRLGPDGPVKYSFGPDDPTPLGLARVMQIAVGPGGEVAFAAVDRGIGRLRPTGEILWYGPRAGLPKKIYSVQFDGAGRLLAAAGDDGAWVRNGSRFERLDLGGRTPEFVRRVIVLAAGMLCLATQEGVLLQRDGVWEAVVAEGTDPGANNVYDVLRDRSGRLLVAAAAGLYEVVGDRLVAVSLGEATLDRPVYLLLEDRTGTIWMGTDNGAYLWDGSMLDQRSVSHGLAGRETNRGAGLVDVAGQVWIGTEGGASVYRASLDHSAMVAPPIAEIRLLEAGNQEHPTDQQVNLEPGDNDLFFRVAGISLSHSQPLLMKYFLEGYDDVWVGPQPLTSAPLRYTNLPPGNYRFHFRVGRSRGAWSATRSSGLIVVGKPFWQKPWLQGLGLLALAVIALALYRFDVAKRRAALHDPLTGLPNRMLFTQRLRTALERKGRAGEPGFAVLFLDLDRFKNINDSLGHAAGDQLLAEIARRLTMCVQTGDTISRLGGDEFTVLLDGIRRGEDVGSVAQRLQRAFEAPFRLRGHDVFAGASIGIALGSAHYRLPEEVLRDADTAMYRAKEHGGGRYEFFDPSMHEKAVVLLRLETDLRRALERGQLRLYYQPVIRLDTGEQVGCEALLRWQHPERGLLAPEAFLEVAEDTGLILPIGEWVLREACAQVAAWRRAGVLPERFQLAVNVSPKQLARPDLAERIAQILRVAGWSGMDLTLEITENSLMSGPDSLKWLLKRCRDIGVSFAIDDFGTGHSSLSYLQNFPVQALKIDRVFVARMGSNPASVEIVRTIVDLGRNLGLEVIAEGVETARQAAYLRAIGCNLAQGYLFSGPIPAANLIQYISVPKAV